MLQGSDIGGYLEWITACLQEHLDDSDGEEDDEQTCRAFILSWNYYSTAIIRDLTLRCAESFGMHLHAWLRWMWCLARVEWFGVGVWFGVG